MSKTFLDFWEQLTVRLGVPGAVALALAVLVAGTVLALWRYGTPVLLWSYLVLAFLAASVQTVEYREPVLPATITAIAASLRWVVLILLAAMGGLCLLTGRVRFDLTVVLSLMWILLAGVSSLASDQESPALERALALSLIVGAAFVTYRFIRSHDRLNRFMRTFHWTGIALAVLLVIASLGSPGGVFTAGRFRGFADNPNMMGFIAFTMMAPAAWAWLSDASSKPGKIVGAVAMGFWMLVIILTGSRAALLGTAPVLVAAMALGGRKVAFWLIGPMVVPAVIWAAVGLVRAEAHEHMFSLDIESRWAHTLYGLELMAKRPILGHGYGYTALNVRFGGGRPLHNGYLAVGVDLGLIGVALVALLASASLLNAFRSSRLCRRIGYSNAAPLILGTLVVSLMLNATVEGWLTGIGSPQLFLFVILIGALGAARGALHDELQILAYGSPEDMVSNVQPQTVVERGSGRGAPVGAS